MTRTYASEIFRPLSGGEESYRLAFAFFIVTIVYMAGFAAVGLERQHARDAALQALDPEKREQVLSEVNRLGGFWNCSFLQYLLPCPDEGSENAHRLAKALTVIDPDRVAVRNSLKSLEDTPWRRLFGAEQYISYVLACWAAFLLLKQRSSVRRALSACERMDSLSRTDLAEHATALRSRLDRGLAIVRFVIWATPTIGFIGTVRHMGAALGIADDPENISQITAFLGTAFDTTMIGLVLSVALQLLQHAYERDEDDFMSEVNAPARKTESARNETHEARDGSLA
jgi:MotA/TolQ/ExbB proton channel family protein